MSSDDAAAASDRGRSGSAAVHVRDLHKSYGDLEVLRGIDLIAEPGEKVAIVGGTGSGKTTLLNLALRLFDVTSGSVLVNGVDVREQDEWDAGHAPDAVHIPMGELPERLGELPEGDVHVVCRSRRRPRGEGSKRFTIAPLSHSMRPLKW